MVKPSASTRILPSLGSSWSVNDAAPAGAPVVLAPPVVAGAAAVVAGLAVVAAAAVVVAGAAVVAAAAVVELDLLSDPHAASVPAAIKAMVQRTRMRCVMSMTTNRGGAGIADNPSRRLTRMGGCGRCARRRAHRRPCGRRSGGGAHVRRSVLQPGHRPRL